MLTFQFANTPKGALGSAVMFSLIETAKEHSLDPYRYLVHVLKTPQGKWIGSVSLFGARFENPTKFGSECCKLGGSIASRECACQLWDTEII